MKRLTTREVQDVCLDVLKNIHSFCVSNNIRYTLYGGTLIGAIRHKGFIPWDDDLDIAMPRPDYEKFISLYEDSEKFKLFTPERGNSDKLYARLCEMSDTCAWVSLPWYNGQLGVWVDIFPIDGQATDEIQFRKEMDVICKVENLSYKVRFAPISIHNSLLRNLRTIVKRIIYGWYDKSKLKEKYRTLLLTHSFEDSDYCGSMGFPLNKYRERVPKQWYDNYTTVQFEDGEFMIVSEYDNLLKHYFNDYMQLPPVDKRQPTHTSVQYFYWK